MTLKKLKKKKNRYFILVKQIKTKSKQIQIHI